jgi:hypothetical protein
MGIGLATKTLKYKKFNLPYAQNAFEWDRKII